MNAPVMPGGGKRKAEEWDSPVMFAVALETASLSGEAVTAGAGKPDPESGFMCGRC